MAVYSCILYLYEVPLVRVRMQEEASHIDYLHVVSGNVTFTGHEKPSCFSEFPEDLKNDSRVLYREVDLRSVVKTDRDQSLAWARERVLRASLPEGFGRGDILLVSDCDELHRKQDLGCILDTIKKSGFAKIPCHNHYYKVNLVHRNPTLMDAPFGVTWEYLDATGLSIQELRRSSNSQASRVSGTHSHHFDYLASPELISAKLKAFAHQEYSDAFWTDPSRILNCIENGLDLFDREPGQVWVKDDLTDLYPESILNYRSLRPDWFI